jgi:hypothetical protein
MTARIGGAGDTTRRRILRGAARDFAVMPYRQVSLHDVVASADVTKAVPHTQFGPTAFNLFESVGRVDGLPARISESRGGDLRRHRRPRERQWRHSTAMHVRTGRPPADLAVPLIDVDE